MIRSNSAFRPVVENFFAINSRLAPHAHLGQRTGTAIASHRKAGHIAQQFAHILGITTFDFRTRNHGDTTAGEFDWNRHTGRSDYNFFTRVARREGRRIGFGGQHARR